MDDVIDKIMSGHPDDGQRAMMSKFNLNKDKLRKIAMNLVQSGKRTNGLQLRMDLNLRFIFVLTEWFVWVMNLMTNTIKQIKI